MNIGTSCCGKLHERVVESVYENTKYSLRERSRVQYQCKTYKNAFVCRQYPCIRLLSWHNERGSYLVVFNIRPVKVETVEEIKLGFAFA
jgi:hypothetical protein